MNYFELYGIPVLMKVDPAEVKKTFYELSRKYHPDFHATSDESVKAEVLEKSSLVNKAFKTFQNPDETIKYVLQLSDLLQEEEKYELGPDFLMEVMDINEKLMEIDMDRNPESLDQCAQETLELLNKSYNEVEFIVENYQHGVTPEKDLLRVKDYYFRKKYLQRILDKIAQMRNIASL